MIKMHKNVKHRLYNVTNSEISLEVIGRVCYTINDILYISM